MKVVFHWRSSSIEGCFHEEAVFQWRHISSVVCFVFLVIYHCRFSAIECYLPFSLSSYKSNCQMKISSSTSSLTIEIIFNWWFSSIGSSIGDFSMCSFQTFVSSVLFYLCIMLTADTLYRQTNIDIAN